VLNRILITGADGQLGTELCQLLAKDVQIIALNRQNCDLNQSDSLSTIIKSYRPSAIVNAAAYTAVDRAENESDIAKIVNAKAPGILAIVARELDIPLIHISTDYVFNGKSFTPYKEDDDTAPLNVYGKTKLEGERAIAEIGGQYLILRTAWVYGSYGKGNFVKTMLRLGKTHEDVRVVSDQIGTPTWTKSIAMTISRLLSINEIESGIYHLTNSGVASWYDFAVAIFDEAKTLGFPLQVKNVIPITTSEYPTLALRPPYSVLSNQKLAKVLNGFLPHWRHDLSLMLQELKAD